MCLTTYKFVWVRWWIFRPGLIVLFRVVCGGKAKHSLLFQGFYFKCEALHCHSWEHKRKLKFTIYQM